MLFKCKREIMSPTVGHRLFQQRPSYTTNKLHLNLVRAFRHARNKHLNTVTLPQADFRVPQKPLQFSLPSQKAGPVRKGVNRESH